MKQVSFSDDVKKGQAVGNIRGEDCTWTVLGYKLGGDPTLDRAFKAGECATISDHKDNVHWFKATSETAFIFNIHVGNYNPENKKTASRVYVDPEGEKLAGGLIVAKKMSSAECHKKYG